MHAVMLTSIVAWEAWIEVVQSPAAFPYSTRTVGEGPDIAIETKTDRDHGSTSHGTQLSPVEYPNVQYCD